MDLIPGGRDNAFIPWLPFTRYGAQFVSQKLDKAPTSWRDFVTWTFSGKNKQLTKIRTFLIKQLLYNTIAQVLDLQLYFNTNEESICL